VVRGDPQRVSSSVLPEIHASSSADGRRLVFTRLESDRTQTWVRDLSTGVQLPLGETASYRQWQPRISRDGKWVAYATEEPGGRLYVVPAFGGQPLLAAEHCAWAWDFSLDDSTLLVRKPLPDPAVYRLDLKSHSLTTFMTCGRIRLVHSRYSPDDRWIVFNLAANDPSTGLLTEVRVAVAPVKDKHAGAQDSWVHLGHKGGLDLVPEWSFSGERIYFLSDEDGHRCVWTQALNPLTKLPLAPPVALRHFHQARASLLNVGLAELHLGVAQDKLFFEIGELSGGIWKLSKSK
jgi:Tol biopolymer transport system component